MIKQVTADNLNDFLPLMKEYQTFYGVEHTDTEKNKSYFSQFTTSNNNGALHLLYLGGKAIGFTVVYKGFSSTRAEEIAILNDLYVQEDYRGQGFGKALMQHALKEAKSLGYKRLQWFSAQNNNIVKKLYNGLGTKQSVWSF